jgi:hypothetical protein
MNNGGLTQTYALLADSPAIDAGNPGAPGSGGFACAAIDQRGFNRLQDGNGDGTDRCDIGAFELAEGSGGFSLSGIRPNTGGNGGSVVALVYGGGFVPGATVKLRRAGQADIIGEMVTVGVSGSILTANFNLTGQALGLWDVVVMNPDDTSVTQTEAFTIEDTRAPQLWADVIGPTRVRVGRPTRVLLLFGNRGNVDAVGTPLLLGIPRSIDFGLPFSITPPPPHAEQVPTNWDAAAFNSISPEHPDFTTIPLFLPVVPAGFTGALEFTITAPIETDGQNFQLLFGVKPPYFTPTLDAQIVNELTNAARAYAEQHLGATIPPELIPDLEQYFTIQL